ncbi:prophage regulatory protein [Pseudomonas migulae]|nr:prophage regulatory protein [Pseudomonas migulae]
MVETKQKCTVTALALSVTNADSIREFVPPTISPMRVSDSELGRFDPAATLIRIHLVMAITGIGRATVYKLMSQPESGFPQSVKLTDSNARGAPVAWVLSEVLSWTRARIAARNEAAA